MVACLNQEVGESWAVYHGDCVELIEGIPDESVGYSIFSPPFASLFVYSDSERDMGNCRDYDEFMSHFGFLINGLYRKLMPGRLVSVHCMNLPTTKQHHGEIGLQDFRGDIIAAFREKGFVYHSEVCIWKDPVTAMQRTKALGLLHKQMTKDSCMSRQGVPDYVCTFRKPGVNPRPVSGPLDRWIGDDSFKSEGNLSIDLWQRYASPVWMDIQQNRTLQYTTARHEDDERHVCVAAGSLVLTSGGYKPIEQIEVGESVLTHKGRWRPVLAKRCTGIQETVTLKAHGVPGLRVTPDHKIWTRLGIGINGSTSHPRKFAKAATPEWVEAKDTLSHYVNLPLPPEEETKWTEIEWWIAGRWLADGHWDGCSRPGLHISCGHHKYEALLGKLGSYAGTSHDTGTSMQIRIKDCGGRIRDLVSLMGKGAAGKIVPREAMCLPVNMARQFLDGYLSGDGHFVEKYGRTTASSVSRNLLLGLAVVYQRVHGVVCSVYAGRAAGVTTIQGRVVNTKPDWIFTASRKNGSAFIADDGAWKKVRSVTESGLTEVWDIQVEEDASFVAEGCVVHNCPLQLDVIERCMELWSLPGDVVLSPYAGIGSEIYTAVLNRRKAIGFELKDSYFAKAVENCRNAEESLGQSQRSLF